MADNFKESVLDKITFALAPVIRKLNDVSISLTGTKTGVFRITQSIRDVMGDYSESLELTFMDNASIKYPFSNIELLAKKDISNNTMDTDALDITDLLPIEMTIKFEGDYTDDPVDMKVGDRVVDVIYDDHNNKIPIILEIVRLKGSFFGKYLVKKTYELSLQRGTPEPDIKAAIDTYISSQ